MSYDIGEKSFLYRKNMCGAVVCSNSVRNVEFGMVNTPKRQKGQ